LVRDDIGYQALVTGRIFTHGHGAFAHLGLLPQHRLDFSELDAESTDFDLAIHAPEKLDAAIRQIAG